MTKAQALALLAMLRAAFPKGGLEQQTVDVYADSMLDLDADCARRAVESLVKTGRWFPSIAEIRDEHHRFWQHRPRPRAIEERQPTPEERAELAGKMREVAERLGLRTDARSR